MLQAKGEREISLYIALLNFNFNLILNFNSTKGRKIKPIAVNQGMNYSFMEMYFHLASLIFKARSPENQQQPQILTFLSQEPA